MEIVQGTPRNVQSDRLGIQPGNGAGIPARIESEDRLLTLSRLLWERRRQLLRAMMAGGAVGLIVGLLSPNVYQSTTRLMPPDSQSGPGLAAMAGLASRLSISDLDGFTGDVLRGQSKGELFVGVLRSRTAQEQLVDQFDLRSVYGIPWLRLRSQREDARKELDRNSEISEDRKSGIISIAVVDRDPKRAAELAKGYVDRLNQLLATLNTSAARREREFLEQRLKEVKKDLDAAAQQLGEFSSKNSTFDPKDQGHAMVAAVANLQGELIAAQAQMSGLEAIYTSNNSRVRGVRARIAELQRQLAKVSGGSSPGPAPVDNSEFAPPFPSLRQLPLLDIGYADRYRRAKIQETVFQVLTQQYEMAKVQEAKEIPTVRVLDVADVPIRKWGPHRALQTILGAVVGLLLGCLWVGARGRWEMCSPENPYKSLFAEIYMVSRQHWLWRRSSGIVRAARTFSSRYKAGRFNNGHN